MEEPGGLHSPWGRKKSDTTERLHLQDRKEAIEPKDMTKETIKTKPETERI